jgi:hypothetical protein
MIPTVFDEMDDEDLVALTAPMLLSVVNGRNARSYETFSRYFAAELKATLGETEFLASLDGDRRGAMTDPEPIGIIRRRACIEVVWKQAFEESLEECLGTALIADQAGHLRIVDCCIE